MVEPTPGNGRVLVDRDLDARLARDGIVSVPLFDPATLAEVEAAYWALVPAGERGIVLDYLRDDRDLVRALHELVAPVWESKAAEVFEQHYPVYSSFVVKHPGEGSDLFLHRDLQVDDERTGRTYALWVPFVATGPGLDNGPLAFVRGSEAIRYGAYGPNAVGVFSPYDEHLRTRLEPMDVPAGTGLVYDARLLHASAPNRTDRPRVAVGSLLARRGHPVIQVMATGRRHRVVHSVDRRYFLDHAPAGVAAGGMPARYPVIEEYDEEPAVAAAEVLPPALAPDRARRIVIVPEDLAEVAGAREPLVVDRTRPPRHRHDLLIRAGDLPGMGTTVGDGAAVEARGPVGARPLWRRGRRVNPVPEAVPDAVVPLDPVRTRDATLVVVDPGARVVLTAAEAAGCLEVVVLECPAVRAGACAAGRVAELDLGVRILPAPGEPLHLWNDGPGPLVLVVRRARSLSRRRAPMPR